MTITSTWKKDCDCKEVHARYGGVHYRMGNRGDAWVMEVFTSDGPVCDGCKKPWRRLPDKVGAR